ncbi:Collagen alpha-1(VII) chain isoform X3 [Aix galericulata]|nr:Collagen alpha-1(VII) chain isoform X3 [Aix galericulata]
MPVPSSPQLSSPSRSPLPLSHAEEEEEEEEEEGHDGHLLTATTDLEYDSTYADEEEEEEEEEDYDTAPEQPAADASPCGQPLEEGGCERYTLRWYYSQRGAECRPFVYSGCGGNANRFGSRRHCELHCGRHAGTGAPRDERPEA